ncbi:MAG: DUF3592 domain-containing protein [Alkalispirochaeta sp.]
MSRRIALFRLTLRTITAAFFFLAAVLLLGRFRSTAEWASTLGTVESVSIVPSGDPEDSRAPGDQVRINVTYTFSTEDGEQRGTTVAVFDWIFRNRNRAQRYLDRYGIAPHRRVPVYYAPDDPDQSVLVREIPWRRLEVLGGVLFLVLLPGAVVVFSVIDVVKSGSSRREDGSRGRFW